MSVDISQLTARLDPQQQEAVKQQYEERATNPTATFLLCFFLGSAGAHRFYLREWRVAFAHLALFLAGIAALAGGLVQTLPLTVNLASHPVGATLDVVGVLLLLAALIWEIIDLGRIDHQVYQRNLLLAEGIIAGTLLADHTIIDETLLRLESTSQRAREQAHAASAPAASVAEAAGAAGAGIITASEVADARALAEESSGLATISYTEMSRFDVSAPPEETQQAVADAAHDGAWTESATTLDAVPGATPDAAPTPVAETITHTHTEDGSRVTDSYEVDHVEGPSAADVMGLGAAGLGVAGLGAAALGAEALAHEYVAGFDEPTQPDVATSAAPQASAFDPTDAQPTPHTHTFDPTDGFATATAPTSVPETTPESAPEPAQAASYDANGYDFEDDDPGDFTDASLPAVTPHAADVGVAYASPVYIQLPDEPGAQTETYTSAAPEEPDASLYLIPDEAAAETTPEEPYSAAPAYGAYDAYDAYDAYSAYDAAPSEEPPAEAYVPPVASVFSSPAEPSAPPTPSWDQPTIAQAAPEPEAQAAEDDTLAELAGYAGAAGAGALAADAWAHSHTAEPEPVAAEPVSTPMAAAEPAPEPVAAPEPPKMKRIRVRRKVVVDGQVVAEEVVEREVPADMDTAEAAAQIQAELAHFTPEQIAQRANLSPDEEVELRQRTEGPSGAQ